LENLDIKREKSDMSLQRIFSLFITIISAAGIAGSLKLAMTAPHNIGPGFAPLVFSLGLLLCAFFLFVQDKSEGKYDVLVSLLKGVAGKAFVFFLLNILMLILMWFLGSVAAMIIFSILACIVLKRQTLPELILFSIVWIGILYFIFAVLLKIPFEQGLIFEILGITI
jgi:hypothetical protein